MHQGHNIPWNIITTNFKFVCEDKRFTPTFTGLVSKERPGAPKELKYFVQKFVSAIHTFSETERSKYPITFSPLSSGKLFSDDLRHKHPQYLNAKNQQVEHWIQRGSRWQGPTPATPTYTTGDGDLADVIKVLLYENEMETLLMLAKHPSIPIAMLHDMSWGHHFGFSRVKESAISSYMFFNAAEATGILENGKYRSTWQYSPLLRDIGVDMDYPAQQIPHRIFLRDCGVLEDNECGIRGGRAEDALIHKNYGRLQEYLKTLFALMYRYDVLVHECGLDPRWEEEIAYQPPLAGHVKMEWNQSKMRHILV